MFLSQARLSSWYVAPFLNNRLLNLSWVGSRSGADFFWNIDTFFLWFKKRYQFGNMFANPWMTVSFLSKHSSAPGTWVVPGPQTSRGTFLHSVSGLYFLTFPALVLHFWTPM